VPRDAREAARLFRLASQQSFCVAQVFLAWCYLAGAGVVRSTLIAACLFQLAAEQAYSAAYEALSSMNLNEVHPTRAFYVTLTCV
jgi:TPR repeat protein